MKLMIIGVILVLGVLLLLFFFQNKIIYVPSFGQMIPRFMKDNPIGYRSPSEKGLQFRDVNIETSDGENLHGWFVYKNEHRTSFKPKNLTQKTSETESTNEGEILSKIVKLIFIKRK
jgi:hypothetical protein